LLSNLKLLQKPEVAARPKQSWSRSELLVFFISGHAQALPSASSTTCWGSPVELAFI
jgi:hypothetical protein